MKKLVLQGLLIEKKNQIFLLQVFEVKHSILGSFEGKKNNLVWKKYLWEEIS